MDAPLIAAFMAAGGGGAVLLALVKGLIDWLSGAASRERDANTNIISQRRTAIEESKQSSLERDAADRKRRLAEEYVAMLRFQIVELGHRPKPRPRNDEDDHPEELDTM